MDKLPHPFPTYIGPPLPLVLKPWNPRHYGLLFMWIFFQPSRLLHYLWQADSDLYRASGRKSFRALQQPAYRNVILMMPILVAALATGVAVLVSWLQQTPVQWNALAVGVAFGVAVGMAFGVAVGVAFAVAGDVAVGVAGFIGGSRLLFQLATWPLAQFSLQRQKQRQGHLDIHPVFWDELAVWPLPGTVNLLQTALATDLTHGIRYAAHIAANPFQRGRVQQALHHWLHKHPAPIVTLYSLARQSDLDTYAFPLQPAAARFV